MAKYWVAGATGFLGRHLVRQLRARGDDVVAVSFSGGQVDDVTVQRCDVHDAAAVKASAAGCDGAFLCTGRVSWNPNDAGDLHRLHVLGTRVQLAALKELGLKRVCYASTSGTIAVSEKPETLDESAPYPLRIVASWPYYRTKIYGEMEALQANSPDFEVVMINPSLLFGPDDLKESSTTLVRQFLEGSLPAAPPGGLSFVDARDAATGMILAFDKATPGERYLLSGKNLTFVELFERLERMTGVPAPALRLPAIKGLATGANALYSSVVRAIGGKPAIEDSEMEIAVHYWYANAAKAERELGWAPRDPGETLRDTVDDLINRNVVFPKRRGGGAFRGIVSRFTR